MLLRPPCHRLRASRNAAESRGNVVAEQMNRSLKRAYRRSAAGDPLRAVHRVRAVVEPLQPVHTATPDTTKLSRLRRRGGGGVRFGGVNSILPDNSRPSPTDRKAEV